MTKRQAMIVGAAVLALGACTPVMMQAYSRAQGASDLQVRTFGAAQAGVPLSRADEVQVLAVGDIADEDPHDTETAAILDRESGPVLLMGDNAYPEGTAAQYLSFFEPTYGRHKERLWPTPGNHEYRTPGAAGYFSYFGARAGDPRKGYYAVDLSPHWRAVMMNSNEDAEGSLKPNSPQYGWAKAQFAEAKAQGKNVVVCWHHPRWSSGAHGDEGNIDPFWRLAVEGGVDLALWGHDHDYERFLPADVEGKRDPKGMTSMVVGTGGRQLYRPFFRFKKGITAVRQNDAYGVLKLVLKPKSFAWQFLPVAGERFADAGEAGVR